MDLYPSVWGADLYSKIGFALAPALSVATQVAPELGFKIG